MKKIILYTLSLALLTAGCTSKEQDNQIKAFWQNQLAELIGVPAVPPGAFAQTAEPATFEEDATVLVGEPADFSVTVEEPAPEPVNPQPTLTATQPQAATQPAQQTTAAAGKRFRVYLFTHSNSPLCQQLKQDQWDKTFQQKHQDKIELVEYDMIDPANRQPLRTLMRLYQLPSLTVPILFVGSHILPGYPFSGEDEAVQQALEEKAQAEKRAAQRAAQRAAREKAERERKKNPTQFMEIIMEDEAPLKNPNASARDRRAMQQAIATVQQSNQQALNDIGAMFDGETQAAAFAITARTERLLKNKASDSPDYQTYVSFQKRLLTLQERDLNQLMRQNAGKLKAIRG